MKPVILFKKKIKPGINPDLEFLIDNHFSYNRKHNFEWQCWLIFPLKKKKVNLYTTQFSHLWNEGICLECC